MQWEIIYVNPDAKETYRKAPGRLWTPVPRTPKEVADAVQFILVRYGSKHLTITAIEDEAAPFVPPHHD